MAAIFSKRTFSSGVGGGIFGRESARNDSGAAKCFEVGRAAQGGWRKRHFECGRTTDFGGVSFQIGRKRAAQSEEGYAKMFLAGQMERRENFREVFAKIFLNG